jgi:hypothetical protein
VKACRSVGTRSMTLCVLASLAVLPSLAACVAKLFMHNFHHVPVCLRDASRATKSRRCRTQSLPEERGAVYLNVRPIACGLEKFHLSLRSATTPGSGTSLCAALQPQTSNSRQFLCALRCLSGAPNAVHRGSTARASPPFHDRPSDWHLGAWKARHPVGCGCDLRVRQVSKTCSGTTV